MMAKKIGTPISAVHTPTGISLGEKATRQIASVTTSRTAPSSALAGTSARCRGPTTKRMACGTISPTKPMAPTLATADAVTTDVTTSRTRRTRCTSTPSDEAVSPPRARASRAPAYQLITARPSSSTTAPVATVAQRAEPIDPSSQKVMARVASASPAAMSTSEVIAEKGWPTTTPVSTTRMESRPLRRSSRSSRPSESSAPTTAPPVSPIASPTPSTATTTAPVEAPAEMPRR